MPRVTVRATNELLAEIRACRACEEHLPLGPRPVIAAHPAARVLVAGQAPGTRVHETGVPWNDPSGELLRAWMAVDRDTFYDPRRIALVPAGFCYPGRGRGGDLPPRPECAELWLAPVLAHLPSLRLVLTIGAYAQALHLGERRRTSLSETVHAYREYLPTHLPLPHPSPRNRRWIRERPWFEREVLPAVRREVARALA